MRILWYSNAPWAPTGYGVQTMLIAQHLPRYGHDLAILANWGLKGSILNMGSVQVYPGGRDGYSNDVIHSTCEAHNADVFITNYDLWPLDFWKRHPFPYPWVAWLPIDHVDVPATVSDALFDSPVLPVSYSAHGLAALQRHGVNSARYVPMGVDTKVYHMVKRTDARERLGWPQKAFIMGMVGANTGFPNRKAIPETLEAYKRFQNANPSVETLFYLHTRLSTASGGFDVKECIRQNGITDGLVTVDQFLLNRGLPPNYMCDVYNAMDVLLSPSYGEGFGIPMVEALACGTPIIGTRVTSIPEFIGDDDRGILVDGERWWSPQGGWQLRPRVRDIQRAMQNMLISKLQGFEWRMRCREHAVLNYDFETVVAPAWDSYLRSLPL